MESRKTPQTFHPRLVLKNATIQSILGSLRIRELGARAWVPSTKKIIVTTQAGVRLQGFYTPRQGRSQGMVILLHGWEGSAQSTYVLTAGNQFYQHGYDVLRLNYRDHGKSHHLNSGLFFATNLQEVFECVSQAAALSNGKPVFLAGFSLGGNFALRIARQCAVFPIEHLRRVVAISPVFDPSKATDCIDQLPLFRIYFLKKWRLSLKQKQELFPDLYDFSRALRSRSCREMTETLLSHHPEYSNPTDYFKGYALTGTALADMVLPATTIITAADDPIIPVDDFHALALNDNTNLIIHRYGGHNGFIDGLFSTTWHERYMVTVFAQVKKSEEVLQIKGHGRK